jgi:hypothetical protein
MESMIMKSRKAFALIGSSIMVGRRRTAEKEEIGLPPKTVRCFGLRA